MEATIAPLGLHISQLTLHAYLIDELLAHNNIFLTDSKNEHVFLNAFGNPMRPASVQNMFRRLKKVAGIKDKRVSAHTCRHWFAVNCIKRGIPSTVLQGLLGHEQLEMINTYVRLAEQDTRDLYAAYSPVDALDMHHTPRGKREKLREWRNARKRNGNAKA